MGKHSKTRNKIKRQTQPKWSPGHKKVSATDVEPVASIEVSPTGEGEATEAQVSKVAQEIGEGIAQHGVPVGSEKITGEEVARTEAVGVAKLQTEGEVADKEVLAAAGVVADPESDPNEALKRVKEVVSGDEEAEYSLQDLNKILIGELRELATEGKIEQSPFVPYGGFWTEAGQVCLQVARREDGRRAVVCESVDDDETVTSYFVDEAGKRIAKSPSEAESEQLIEIFDAFRKVTDPTRELFDRLQEEAKTPTAQSKVKPTESSKEAPKKEEELLEYPTPEQWKYNKEEGWLEFLVPGSDTRFSVRLTDKDGHITLSDRVIEQKMGEASGRVVYGSEKAKKILESAEKAIDRLNAPKTTKPEIKPAVKNEQPFECSPIKSGTLRETEKLKDGKKVEAITNKDFTVWAEVGNDGAVREVGRVGNSSKPDNAFINFYKEQFRRLLKEGIITPEPTLPETPEPEISKTVDVASWTPAGWNKIADIAPSGRIAVKCSNSPDGISVEIEAMINPAAKDASGVLDVVVKGTDVDTNTALKDDIEKKARFDLGERLARGEFKIEQPTPVTPEVTPTPTPDTTPISLKKSEIFGPIKRRLENRKDEVKFKKIAAEAGARVVTSFFGVSSLVNLEGLREGRATSRAGKIVDALTSGDVARYLRQRWQVRGFGTKRGGLKGKVQDLLLVDEQKNKTPIAGLSYAERDEKHKRFRGRLREQMKEIEKIIEQNVPIADRDTLRSEIAKLFWKRRKEPDFGADQAFAEAIRKVRANKIAEAIDTYGTTKVSAMAAAREVLNTGCTAAAIYATGGLNLAGRAARRAAGQGIAAAGTTALRVRGAGYFVLAIPERYMRLEQELKKEKVNAEREVKQERRKLAYAKARELMASGITEDEAWRQAKDEALAAIPDRPVTRKVEVWRDLIKGGVKETFEELLKGESGKSKRGLLGRAATRARAFGMIARTVGVVLPAFGPSRASASENDGIADHMDKVLEAAEKQGLFKGAWDTYGTMFENIYKAPGRLVSGVRHGVHNLGDYLSGSTVETPSGGGGGGAPVPEATATRTAMATHTETQTTSPTGTPTPTRTPTTTPSERPTAHSTAFDRPTQTPSETPHIESTPGAGAPPEASEPPAHLEPAPLPHPSAEPSEAGARADQGMPRVMEKPEDWPSGVGKQPEVKTGPAAANAPQTLETAPSKEQGSIWHTQFKKGSSVLKELQNYHKDNAHNLGYEEGKGMGSVAEWANREASRRLVGDYVADANNQSSELYQHLSDKERASLAELWKKIGSPSTDDRAEIGRLIASQHATQFKEILHHQIDDLVHPGQTIGVERAPDGHIKNIFVTDEKGKAVFGHLPERHIDSGRGSLEWHEQSGKNVMSADMKDILHPRSGIEIMAYDHSGAGGVPDKVIVKGELGGVELVFDNPYNPSTGQHAESLSHFIQNIKRDLAAKGLLSEQLASKQRGGGQVIEKHLDAATEDDGDLAKKAADSKLPASKSATKTTTVGTEAETKVKGSKASEATKGVEKDTSTPEASSKPEMLDISGQPIDENNFIGLIEEKGECRLAWFDKGSAHKGVVVPNGVDINFRGNTIVSLDKIGNVNAIEAVISSGAKELHGAFFVGSNGKVQFAEYVPGESIEKGSAIALPIKKAFEQAIRGGQSKTITNADLAPKPSPAEVAPIAVSPSETTIETSPTPTPTAPAPETLTPAKTAAESVAENTAEPPGFRNLGKRGEGAPPVAEPSPTIGAKEDMSVLFELPKDLHWAAKMTYNGDVPSVINFYDADNVLVGSVANRNNLSDTEFILKTNQMLQSKGAAGLVEAMQSGASPELQQQLVGHVFSGEQSTGAPVEAPAPLAESAPAEAATPVADESPFRNLGKRGEGEDESPFRNLGKRAETGEETSPSSSPSETVAEASPTPTASATSTETLTPTETATKITTEAVATPTPRPTDKETPLAEGMTEEVIEAPPTPTHTAHAEATDTATPAPTETQPPTQTPTEIFATPTNTPQKTPEGLSEPPTGEIVSVSTLEEEVELKHIKHLVAAGYTNGDSISLTHEQIPTIPDKWGILIKFNQDRDDVDIYETRGLEVDGKTTMTRVDGFSVDNPDDTKTAEQVVRAIQIIQETMAGRAE